MPGNDTASRSADGESTAADAFALVGHEIRVEVIKILGEKPKERELSFSELRGRLSTDVEPSQLHYHLQKLVGHFVENTDGGYSLRPAGAHLCLALHAGTFHRRQEQLSVETDVACYYCQSPVEAGFNDGWYAIECSECTAHYGVGFLGVPLDAFDDAAAAFSHLRRYETIQTVFLSYGVCPSCVHPLSQELQLTSEDSKLRNVRIFQPCDLCGANWSLPVGRALLTDPDLIAFCADHGVDVLSTPHWELEFAATDHHLTIRSTDPWEVALAVTFDHDTLELVVDGDLNIVESNRLNPDGVAEVVLPEKDDCLQSLRRQRWPEGVTCPHCDSGDTIKKGASKKDAQRYQCHACNRTFTDLTGTIFAGRGLSLPEMVYIIREMDEMTTAGIARQLDRSYKSVLNFVHEVQDAREQATETNSHEGGDLDSL